jgi:hypothetical protein
VRFLRAPLQPVEVSLKRKPGGSTNIEKKRKKNFQMQKHSMEARVKGNGKGTLSKRSTKAVTDGHDAKKRRRKDLNFLQDYYILFNRPKVS